MDTMAAQEPKKKKRIVKTTLDWAEELVIAVVIVSMVFTFLFRVITVTGTSMIPSFHDGDRVLVASSHLALKQGDVVVITNVLREPIIKRVIATEGQTVNFDYENGRVLVDGEALDESRFGLENGVTKEPYTSFELLDFPQEVPPGCVFVLGDNRSVSEDSRYRIVGMVDERNVLGKAVFRLFSAKGSGKDSDLK